MTQNNLNPENNSYQQWLIDIYEQEYDGLIFFIVGFIKEEQYAEDILGTSFSKLILKVNNASPGEFTARANVKAFLVTTIKNDCISWLRKKETEKLAGLTAPVADNPHPVYQLEKRDYLLRLQSLIQSTIDELPVQLREVARLTWIENCSIGEIAQRMNLDKEIVSVYKTRALNKLRPLVIKQKHKLPPGELFLALYWLHALA